MECLLAPLNKLRLPVHETAMIVSIALRFIPAILEELDRIMLAQRARGADFSSKNIKSRIKHLMPLIIPLFVSAFRRADELAEAMEAKCYHGGKDRTRWKKRTWQAGDTFALCLILIILLIYILKAAVIF
jgi:energy-coupling factor transport system permease protein